MEAIGAIASIIGVAGAGAKLSIVLFEFASTVGSAGQEVKQIGIEISLFCSVLKQLQSTLTKAKAYRYSLSAIETTQEILDQCQKIFSEIETIVTKLSTGHRTSERSAESTRNLIKSVKWTFKRSKVQLLRTTLESCKVTLCMMLSTLDFAQTIATRRMSTVETDAEDAQEAVMTHSLIIAHQCTVDTLQRLEEEVQHQEQQQTLESNPLSPPVTPKTPPSSRVVRGQVGHVSSRSTDNQNLRAPLLPDDTSSKRASVWVNNLIFDDSPLPLGFRRQTWGDAECTLFLSQQPYYFLQKWTDQGEYLKELQNRNTKYQLSYETPAANTVNGKETETRIPDVALLSSTPRPHAESVRERRESRLSSLVVAAPETAAPQNESFDDLWKRSTWNSDNNGSLESQRSPKIASSLGIINETPKSSRSLDHPQSEVSPRHPQGPMLKSIETAPSSSGASVEIFRRFRVSMEDPCYKVLPAALRKYNINAPWEQYALYIVYGDKEQCLGMNEKPLILFKQLHAEGKKPMFMLRKIVPKEPSYDSPGGII